DAYATLIGLARSAGALTLLDTSGPALLAGGAARPDLLKPNAGELAESGLDPAGLTVALSRGKDGILLSSPDGCWTAAPPEVLSGNPTGAGDAAAASLALSLHRGEAWPSALVSAVALSAAAVVTPEAGDVDLDVYRRIQPNVIVEETSCPW
ncbi:PfkB family carbohydrate kinase, partial [Actinocorallia lasiicapitis]